jgi:signal transduction histidine kinase
MADSVVGKRRSPLRNPLRLLVSREPWLAFLFMLLSFVLGVFWFVVLVTLISVGSGLVITLVGLPILAATLLLWIQGARLERLRVRALLGEPIHDPYHAAPEGANWWGKLKTRLVDRHTWLDLLYLFLLFPIGIAEFVIAMTATAFPLSLVTMPAYYWAGDSPDFFTMRIDTLPEAFAVALIGLPLLLATPYILVGVGRGHAWLARHLLGRNREAELSERVGQLTVSRSQALESAVGDLRRIERDLHDGAQQRLVTLSLELGLIRNRLDEGTDPEIAAQLESIGQELREAIDELRELARGIHPSILTDSGLAAALESLAKRSALPVSLDNRCTGRLPERVEVTAYFVVAEALTNVAKYAQASRVVVRLESRDGMVRVEVDDDGNGGADPGSGSGLSGLQDRVSAIGGQLWVESPPGEGTQVWAEIPVAESKTVVDGRQGMPRSARSRSTSAASRNTA